MKNSLLIKQTAGTLLFYSILFICAGRIMYWPGLVYAAIGTVMIVLNYTLFRLDKDLMTERSKPHDDTKKWDKTVLLTSFLTTLGMYCTAGFDSGRFQWSPQLDMAWIITGAVLTAAGQLIFLIAQKQNRFFSSTVRIQKDRGHIVCDKGLYGFVRHPAYLGSILQAIGFPLLFSSLWSIIPVAILILIHLIRTALEDQTLRNELEGYQSYALKTRYRLIPFVW